MKRDGFISTAMAYTFLLIFAFLLLTLIEFYNNNISLNRKIVNVSKDNLFYNYTYFEAGTCTEYVAPAIGRYKIELWGADGGSANSGLVSGGRGAYTSGIINLFSNDVLYFCVGKTSTDTTGGYNGGGNGEGLSSGGGGSTDVRLVKDDVNSRIMVAGGGGGASYANSISYGLGGHAGGLTGISGFNLMTSNTSECTSLAGGQTSGSAFLTGGNGTNNAAGGGGGYWGGAGSTSTTCGAAGGSSYISGHLGSVAITLNANHKAKCSLVNAAKDINCSLHYSNKYFVNTIMVDGGGNSDTATMPTVAYKDSTSVVLGDGSARISRVISLEEVASDTDIACEPAVAFGTDSWETISCNIKNGNISKYKVGDIKAVTLEGYGTHQVRIANISTPEECNNEGFSQSACGFVLEFTDILAKYAMNTKKTNIGGWPASDLYKFVNGTDNTTYLAYTTNTKTKSSVKSIYMSLPEDLRNIIIDTTVVSGHGPSDKNNFASTDKLYLLDGKELYGTTYTEKWETAKGSERQLDYYLAVGSTTSNKTKIVKQYNSANLDWWIRTADSGSNGYFFRVGSGRNSTSNVLYGVSVAFRIG